MALDLDEGFDTKTAKVITLAGREFYIAPLPLRQIIALSDCIPKMSGMDAKNFGPDYITALIEVLHRGLIKAYPRSTKDDLLDMPIRLDELVAAVPIVIEQAGGKKVDPTEAASSSTGSTGDGSSPASS